MQKNLKEYSVSHYRSALKDDAGNLENQILTLSAIEGYQGLFFKLQTPIEGVGWSFSEVEELTDMIKSFIRDANTILDGDR